MVEKSKISKDQVVTIHYTLTDEHGDLIESTEGTDPLSYLHGHNQVAPGLEKALEGKEVGYKTSISVPPDDGYGEVNPQHFIKVPKEHFDFEVDSGNVVRIQLPDDSWMAVEVVDVDDEGVTLNANHPLAGKTLNFELEVIQVRPATASEKEHGHSHS